MADVARLAGVSSQTVSRVSNGDPAVVDKTRQKVLAAMRELDYRPNSAARALKWGEFRTIGVITMGLTSTGNVRTLDAIARNASHAGYAVTLMPLDAPTQDNVRGAFTRLGELAVDAVVLIMEVHLLNDQALSLPPHVKVVVVDSDAGDRFPVVDTDQRQGAEAAVRHLLDLGHRTVWHVAGPEESFAAGRRAEAWDRTLRAEGREVPPLLRGDWTPESGYLAGRELAADPECTAVFVANDQMALGVLRALHEAGRRVPEDVSVVGFDDILEGTCFSPPLTTVHQDFSRVGELCVETVLRELRGEEVAEGVRLVPTRLVVRDSTAAPGAAESGGKAAGTSAKTAAEASAKAPARKAAGASTGEARKTRTPAASKTAKTAKTAKATSKTARTSKAAPATRTAAAKKATAAARATKKPGQR